MATIKDVAREAGVSEATVSRVINNSKPVEDETKQLVLNAIQKLNFQPNLNARNLRRSESRLVLVLIPYIRSSFYNEIIAGIQEVARLNKYNILICDMNKDPEIEKESLTMLINKVVDGAIFLGSRMDKEYIDKLSKSYPLLFCCENNCEADVTFISIDNYKASYEATKHLIDFGHRNIALLGYDATSSSSKFREAGYRKCLEDHGIEFNENLVLRNISTIDEASHFAKKLLTESNPPPTAMFGMADIYALGAIQGANELKIKVPDDLSVIGFDNLEISNISTPKLTTMGQPIYKLGKTAMEVMLDTIKNKVLSPKRFVLEHELVIRNSTSKVNIKS